MTDKWIVRILDIKEFTYDVEADDELTATAKGERLFAADGGPQNDYIEVSAIKAMSRGLETMRTPTPLYVYTVEGTGEFPRDMTRYDRSVGLTDTDQTIIDATFDTPEPSPLWNGTALRRNQVRLLTASRIAPNRERWLSFTWRVCDGPDPISPADRRGL